MSKAFTRESDDAPEPSVPRSFPTVPPGVTNYMTSHGAERLREELTQLTNVERPRLAAPSGEDAKQKLAAIDQRIRHLQQTLHSAVIVAPSDGPQDVVRFGARVVVRDREGEAHYQIVGVDEADAERGLISFISPLAKVLMNRKIGDKIRLNQTELEIVSVRYE